MVQLVLEFSLCPLKSSREMFNTSNLIGKIWPKTLSKIENVLMLGR